MVAWLGERDVEVTTAERAVAAGRIAVFLYAVDAAGSLVRSRASPTTSLRGHSTHRCPPIDVG